MAAQTRVLKRFSAIEAIDHRTDYDLVITDRGLPGTVQIEGAQRRSWSCYIFSS